MTKTSVTREQVLAFCLQRHNLGQRLPAGSLIQAAAVCGIQNSPPGSALLSLHARVQGVSGAELDRALLADKSLVQVWSVRSAPLIVPVEEAAIFTHGLLPGSEEEVRFFIRGAGEHLQRMGLAAANLVEWTAAALDEALDGRSLTKDQLGSELSRRLVQRIPAEKQELWCSPDEWGHFGESLARFALNAVALRGAFCLVSHPGAAATFVRTDQWLGHAFAPVDDAARLLRCFLRTYGPSTIAYFAQWAGIALGQAQRMWRLIEDELAPVRLGAQSLWLLSADAPCLASAVLPAGVRLLPPHDPYLAARNRALLLPDRSRHAQTWRNAGSPGAVLYNGEIAATWHAQKKLDTLHVSVEGFGPLPPDLCCAVAAEAEAAAPLRGCTAAAITFAE